MEHRNHQWERAQTMDRKIPIDFWICLFCGKISPGPTDNENLDPRRGEVRGK